MAVVRKCAILKMKPEGDIHEVQRIGLSCPFRDPYSIPLKDYEDWVTHGMFYSFKHEAFGDTRKELEQLMPPYSPSAKN